MYYFISPIILSGNSIIIQDVQQLIPQIMCPRCNKVTGTIIECSLHGMSLICWNKIEFDKTPSNTSVNGWTTLFCFVQPVILA